MGKELKHVRGSWEAQVRETALLKDRKGPALTWQQSNESSSDRIGMHAESPFPRVPLGNPHHQLLSRALADWTKVTGCDRQSFSTFMHIILGQMFLSDPSPEGLLPQECLRQVLSSDIFFPSNRGGKMSKEQVRMLCYLYTLPVNRGNQWRG